jgi:hypothetical protein
VKVGSASVPSSGLSGPTLSGPRSGLGSVSGRDVDLYVYLKDRTALDRIKAETPVSVTTKYLPAAYTISEEFRAGVQQVLPEGTVEIIEKPVDGRSTPDTVGVIDAAATRAEVEGFVEELVAQARQQVDSELNEDAVQIIFDEIVVSKSAPNPENWTRGPIFQMLLGRGPIPILEWTNIKGASDPGGSDPGGDDPIGSDPGPGFRPLPAGGSCPEGYEKKPLSQVVGGTPGLRGLSARRVPGPRPGDPGPGDDRRGGPGGGPIDPSIPGNPMVCVPKSDPPQDDPPTGDPDPDPPPGDPSDPDPPPNDPPPDDPRDPDPPPNDPPPDDPRDPNPPPSESPPGDRRGGGGPSPAPRPQGAGLTLQAAGIAFGAALLASTLLSSSTD